MSVKIFIHGLESSNQGTKSLYFRKRYPDMIIPNFPGTLEERMEKLREVLSGKSGIRLVGSSFGGLMASIFAMENKHLVERLILLAPAINLMEFTDYREKRISVPVWIYHGSNDEVIPLDKVKNMAEKCFPNLFFHIMKDDHSLHGTFKALEWDKLLNE